MSISTSTATDTNVSLARISRSIKTLEARLADQAKEHRERIKRLQNAYDTLEGDVLDNSLSLVNEEARFSPELLDLIDNPTGGL